MKDLTILVQGAYFEKNNYNSNLHIKKLKEKFPESKILVSTWVNEDKYKVNSDEIIYNKDPGVVLDDHVGSATNGCNIQRQITSVINGLRKIKTKYTLKIRSDSYFNSNKILKINTENFKINKKFKNFKKRIIISSIGTLNQSVTGILYNFNDWFNLGLTEDLIKLWGNSKIDDDDIHYFKKYPNKKNNVFGKDWDLRYTSEQFIYYKSISNKILHRIDHAHDFSKKKLIEANNYLINNFYLINPDEIDFIFPKYDPRINKNLKPNNTNIRSKTLIFLSYDNSEWIKLQNQNNNINGRKKINIERKIFQIKFIIKKKLYKYFNAFNTFLQNRNLI